MNCAKVSMNLLVCMSLPTWYEERGARRVLEAGWAARPSKAAADSKAEFALAVVVVDIRSSNGVFSFIFKRPGGLPGPRKQRQTDWLRYR